MARFSLTNIFRQSKKINWTAFSIRYTHSGKYEKEGLSSAEKTTFVGNQKINYLSIGNGKHTILCFPGALGTIWSDFQPQLKSLDSTKFRIIAWDPPGYGKSRPPEKTFSTSFYKDDAETAYLFMKVNMRVEKFSLLGWSDGGISSMILAATYPNVVEKLIVWGSNAYITKKDINAFEGIRDLSKWSNKMKAPLISTYGEDGLQRIWNNWCNAQSQIYKELGGNICKNDLQFITCPTLIIHGDKDPMVAPEHPVYLLQNINAAKLHTFPDGKHNLHLRYPEEFNEIVTRFLIT